jgi:Putative Ig domain
MPVNVAKHGFWWVYNFSPIQVFPGSLSPDDTATPDTVTFTATGGSAPTSPYVFSYTGTIPPGTSLNSSGHLTGTPTTPGTYNFTVTATDANGKTGHTDYTQVITTPDRSVSKSKNVLVVYDPYTPGSIGGNTNYYNVDVNPVDVYNNTLAPRETALGFTPQFITSYSDLLATDISNYAHIWDIGYSTPLTTDVRAKYKTYLQNGGAIFLLGENIYFDNRDTTISSFMTTDMGAGTVQENTSNSYYTAITETVQSEFLLSNSDNSITFNAPNVFDSVGTGTPMAVGGDGKPSAVMWKTGSMSNATKGAVVSVLDINFLIAGDYNPDFVDNICISLNKK